MYVNAFCNEEVAICCENGLYLLEKISMHLTRYEKTYLSNRFVKILENYAPLCVFFGIMRIMRSEPKYAILHPRIIPEALRKKRYNCKMFVK